MTLTYGSPLFMDEEDGVSREDKISRVVFMILVGFIAATAFQYFVACYLRWPAPYNTFLFTPMDAFRDFYNNCHLARNWDPYFEPYDIVKFCYFPLAGLMFSIMAQLPRGGAYGLYVAAFLTPLVFMAARQLRGRDDYQSATNALVVTLLTYPVLFTLDRGNCEGLLFVCLCGSVLMSDSRPIVKSLLLAIPIAMKLYPAVFLVLLLSERQYKQTVLTIAWTVGLTLVSLLCFKGGFSVNLEHVLGGFGLSKTLPLFAWDHSAYNYVGLFMPLKVCLATLNDHGISITFWEEFKHVYRWASLLLFCLLTLYIFFIETERWKKVALLVFAMVLLPEMAAPYKLIHVLLPLFLFINAAKPGKWDAFYACMFCLLLVPKRYYYFPGPFHTDTGNCDLSISTFVDPLVMVVMSIAIVIEGWRVKRSNKTTVAIAADGGSSDILEHRVAT